MNRFLIVSTIRSVEITFDPEENDRNIRERGISFEQARELDFETALYVEDTRKDYGEKRFRAIGYIGRRRHVLVFTMRGAMLRVISLRKANQKEANRHEEEPTQS